ncbi:hypothetical protein [Roseateles asaccharophilus]|uniref:Uncharacterized protein n=1 Tax=Roseateles asaccharophilus TaxID=582607 RepID=A0ABU2AF48_9BURK|nr:hypothetical protein [Roseateles asaccharophilus]MDR7335233.1 hypothetical protein [Roseateles asaccharophilus]
MRALHLTPLLLVLAGPAFGQDASLQRCRVIADTTARLACYDALADARPKPPAAAAAPMTPVAPVAAAPAPAPKPADTFGLPVKRPKGEPETVQSSVGADFAGWGPNQSIKLANGQVWQIIDGTSVSMPRGARNVSVRRGMFGAFHLDFEGLNTSPKVKRLE